MSRTIDSNINDYVTYFQHQVQLVEDHCPKSYDGDLHRRILYIAILDAISRTVFTNERNRDRFVQFIGNFCDWPECNRVSLPHLYQLVRNKHEPEFAPLRDFANQSTSQWIPATKIPLTRDPDITDVEKVWPYADGKPLSIDGVWLNWLQHRHLLYSYRNSLIHEFRTLGRHAEIWDEDEPYYTFVTTDRGENSSGLERSWELQYTAKFFKRLCVSGLSNLEKHFKENRIDPFNSINWGNYWIQELNL